MADRERCKGKTHDRRYPYQEHSCSRSAWKDGYCRTHHPDEKRRRNKESMDRRDALYEASRIKTSKANEETMYKTKEQLLMALIRCLPYPEQIKDLDMTSSEDEVMFNWRGMNKACVSLDGRVGVINNSVETIGHDCMLLQALLQCDYKYNLSNK